MAASRSSIRAGRAVVDVLADDSEFKRKIRRLSRDTIQPIAAQIQAVATGLAASSAAIVAGIGTSVEVFRRLGDQTAKVSDKLGVAVSELSGFQFVASQAGQSVRNFNLAIQRMRRRAAEAAQGLGESKDAIRELGLEAGEFSRLGLQEQLLALREAFESKDAVDRLRLAFKLFDSEGVATVNVLNQTEGALLATLERAKALGGVLSEEDARAAEELTEAMGELTLGLKGVAIQLGAALAPLLTEAATLLADMIVRVVGFIQANRDLVVSLAALSVGILGISTAVVGLTIVIAALEAVASPLLLIALAIVGAFVQLGVAAAGIAVLLRGFDGIVEDLRLMGGLLNDFLTLLLGGQLQNAFALIGETIRLTVATALDDVFGMFTDRFRQIALFAAGEITALRQEAGEIRANRGGAGGGAGDLFNGLGVDAGGLSIRSGSFANAGASLSFGTQAIQQQQLDALQNIQDNTRRLAEEGGPVFG